MAESFRGVFVIAVTPFDETELIDEESLRAQVDFCVEAGADGIVTPANASEWYTLSDEERRRVSRVVVEHTRTRVPVVLSVTGGSQWAAVEMAEAALEAGADGLMAMPPPLKPPHGEAMFRYYQALSEIATVPIIIQNCHPPLGTPMPPELLARMVDELPRVDYIKEEADPCTHLMTRAAGLVKNRSKFKGVFGGQAGRYFMNEVARGACGTMPACDIPDAHAALWQAHERGDQAGTRHLYNRLLPLLTMEALYGTPVYKEVLRRRGVIRTAVVRNPSFPGFDDVDHQELDALLAELSDLLPTKGPFTPGASR
jgi:4-hydroxy-tetrahydrodipicolinate synthase